MINFDGKELQEEFNKAFSNTFVSDQKPEEWNDLKPLTLETLTVQQLWWLVKFAKHVRGRCRSNAALNNYMNRNFPHARFETVRKEGNRMLDNIHSEPFYYDGLKITVNGETMEGEDNE